MPDLLNLIKSVPDYPQKGVIFRDITPLLLDRSAFGVVIARMAERLQDLDLSHSVIAGIESRGFIFASALALFCHCPLLLFRKKGKLPRKTLSVSYSLEYGNNTIEVHEQDLLQCKQNNKQIIFIDDVLATGGTMQACVSLVQEQGLNVNMILFLLELLDLQGREKLSGLEVQSLLQI